jgi:glycerophosphoryl diester phosphodiesterase
MSTLNFGHRGASYDAPENTLSAFRLARDTGADGVELDVALSRDGVAVILHDATVDRTTDGTGAVADLTLAELKALDAGAWFAPQFAGERIPTLAEVFQAVGPDMVVNVELKAMGIEPVALVATVVDCIDQHDMADRVLISCFNPLALRATRQARPDVRLALLYGPSLPQAELARWVDDLRPLAALHPEHRLVTAKHVAWAREHGCQINTWTVDEPEEMRRLIGLGVDGIITDRPDVLRAVIQEEGSDGAEARLPM